MRCRGPVLVASVFVMGCLADNPAYSPDAVAASGSGDQGTTSSMTTDAASTQGHGATQGSAEGSMNTTSDGGDEDTSNATSEPSGSTETGNGMSDETCPDDPSLRVCLSFDVRSPEDVHDQSPGMHPVERSGGGLVDSPWDRAYHFDTGTRMEVECGKACRGGPTVTDEAWVFVEATPSQRAGVVDNEGLLGMFVTNAMRLRCSSAGGDAEGGEIPNATWIHVACVADGESLRSYVGGVLVAEQEIDELEALDDEPTIAIANDTPSFGDPLQGDLDVVRVWSVARSADQIAASATK